MIRVAATGDLHFGPDLQGTVRPPLEDLAERADVLLIAGDITRVGDPEEAAGLAKELSGLAVPVIAVLGNHDYHSDRQTEITEILEDAGIRVLEGEAVTVPVDGATLGVAGTKGFGGGFIGASGSDFGEPEMKAFVRHTHDFAERLGRSLAELDAEHRVALLHYAPVESTLRGERLEIYPFLGSYLLGEAIDSAGADLIVHGHAHRGTERGVTPEGSRCVTSPDRSSNAPTTCIASAPTGTSRATSGFADAPGCPVPPRSSTSIDSNPPVNVY